MIQEDGNCKFVRIVGPELVEKQIEPDLTWQLLTNIGAKDIILGFYNGNQARPSSCLLGLLVLLSRSACFCNT